MNFPSNPAIGQTYTLGDKTWRWNGYAWDLTSIRVVSGQAHAVLVGLGAGVPSNTLFGASHFQSGNEYIIRFSGVYAAGQ